MCSYAVVVVSVDFRIRRRCASPKTTTWSKHSRRIDPINRSAKPFCQGEAGAIGFGELPILRWALSEERRLSIRRLRSLRSGNEIPNVLGPLPDQRQDMLPEIALGR